MKMKHWCGYGSVEVRCLNKKVISTLLDGTKIRRVFSVSGEHEWPLARASWDTTGIEYWLRKWYAHERILSFSTQYKDSDHCTYTIFSEERV